MSAPSIGAVTLAPHRVGAMVLRYLYLLRSSWTRLLELIYWPAVQLFVWGFLQFYIAQIADELSLTEFLDRPTGKLSAGQKTRVALAKALINAPEVLLLDEPTASLDPDTADWVRTRLERYRAERGATVLLASHNMAEVERLCDRVIMMKRGRIEDDDTPAQLLARYGRDTLEEVFLDVARGRGEAAREAAQ